MGTQFKIILCILFIAPYLALAKVGVRKVDFLSLKNLDVNAAAPLLVKADGARNRIVVANTATSSISIIQGIDHSVVNIPIKSRIPQYLKDEALQIDAVSGNIYVLGNRCLHIINPGGRISLTINTRDQFDAVSVNGLNGDAYLVGRDSHFLALVSKKNQKIRTIRWAEKKEPMANLNQTPPPPIRKVIFDPVLNRIVAIDGFTRSLVVFSPSGKILNRRKLEVQDGARWHFAGYHTENHNLYLVIETIKREVVQAVKIDVTGGKDRVISLPGFTEAVGVNCNVLMDEVVIPYDNHPSVHVVSFMGDGSVQEIKVPAYGNDGAAIDPERQILYVSSWAYGEINVLDLKQKKLKKRIRNLGIIPHMFSMCFNPADNKLYIPLGATAVNGSFGSAITVLDTVSFQTEKVRFGWTPVDLVSRKGRDSFLVFNSEDEFAEVSPDGTVIPHQLPCDYPGQALSLPDGYIYLSYGPHQSYWPVVYIWGAKNGILGIDPETLETYDRRIPRLAQKMVLDRDGILYALQNNWGEEKQFLAVLSDPVRSPNQGDMRWEFGDPVLRETTQRILKYDPDKHWLYVVRIGEKDKDPGILQILDIASRKMVFQQPVGITPADLVFDENQICVSNFDDDSITLIRKSDFNIRQIRTGGKPFQLALKGKDIYCINHGENTLQVFGENPRTYSIPFPGMPDALFDNGDELILTIHSHDRLSIIAFSLAKKQFSALHEEVYPFGETTVDTDNSAFYVRGQFGDGIFQINQIRKDEKGRLWITDFLSGKLFIIEKK